MRTPPSSRPLDVGPSAEQLKEVFEDFPGTRFQDHGEGQLFETLSKDPKGSKPPRFL